MSKQKINLLVGSIGAFLGIFVFIAYIPQIFANLQGNKKDWILIIPNTAGVILGGLTFLTAL